MLQLDGRQGGEGGAARQPVCIVHDVRRRQVLQGGQRCEHVRALVCDGTRAARSTGSARFAGVPWLHEHCVAGSAHPADVQVLSALQSASKGSLWDMAADGPAPNVRQQLLHAWCSAGPCTGAGGAGASPSATSHATNAHQSCGSTAAARHSLTGSLLRDGRGHPYRRETQAARACA